MSKQERKQAAAEEELSPAEEGYPLVCFANRELSWLKFNERVLEEACAPENPLGEQLSFAAIFQSNLDEFFMVRVGSIYDHLGTDFRENKTSMSAREQLDAILADAKGLLKRKDAVYAQLVDKLRDNGLEICTFSTLTDKEKRALEKYFLVDVLPLLSPQIVAPKQPFPFLQNAQIYAVISLKTKSGNNRLGIVPCTGGVLKRLISVPGSSSRYILIEDLILQFAALEFEHYRIVSKSLIRITRNADISVDDMFSDAENHKANYRKTMEKMIRMRRKLSPIKLEFQGNIDNTVVDTISKHLNLPKKQMFRSNAPLDLSFLYLVRDALRDRRELFFPRRSPQKSPTIDSHRPMIPQIQEKDKLLSYPYESMRPFLRLLEEAGNDPAVTSIRITLYRVAHNSLVVDALARAAENGKEVLALVELRARFDEENNLDCSRVLEEAGCRIIYGLDGMKTHSKLCLITRQTEEGIQYITQVGTGNYSESTAKQYTDLCLMTANPEIGREAADIFHSLCLGETIETTQHLLVAPHCLQNRLIDLIDGQIAVAKAGGQGYVGIKCNSVTDKVLIEKLIEASQAGVRVEMIVRGIACLVSGISGFTDHIQIISIVGRFLEHSRIYIFGADGMEQIYISSADFMTRNTTRRVEVAAPIYDPDLKAQLLQMFRIMWNDNVKVRVQSSDGTYGRKDEPDQPPLNAQEYFYQEAYRRAGTPLPTNRAAVPEADSTGAAVPAAAAAPKAENAPVEAVPEAAAPVLEAAATETTMPAQQSPAAERNSAADAVPQQEPPAPSGAGAGEAPAAVQSDAASKAEKPQPAPKVQKKTTPAVGKASVSAPQPSKAAPKPAAAEAATPAARKKQPAQTAAKRAPQKQKGFLKTILDSLLRK
ncbi:MAG: polyphosphate kinase 1 [Clostridiales bacterium]|nr:polyphosphate kinase 1 [Clostridiales bacterium]